MVGILDGAAVLVVALMTGSEVGVALFVHPPLSRLDDPTHAGAARALARRLGRVMPFWYAASLLLAAAVAFMRPAASMGQWLAGTAAGLLAASIVMTVLWLVPINNQVAAWDQSALPADWKSQRRRWDSLHAVRVAVLLAASILLTWAVVVEPA